MAQLPDCHDLLAISAIYEFWNGDRAAAGVPPTFPVHAGRRCVLRSGTVNGRRRRGHCDPDAVARARPAIASWAQDERALRALLRRNIPYRWPGASSSVIGGTILLIGSPWWGCPVRPSRGAAWARGSASSSPGAPLLRNARDGDRRVNRVARGRAQERSSCRQADPPKGAPLLIMVGPSYLKLVRPR